MTALPEPLLDKSVKRYQTFPIDKNYLHIWDLYQKQESNFWIVKEIDFSNDHFDELTDNEQFFIKNILAFFAASDGLVNENIQVNFLNDIDIYEVKVCYDFQVMIENIHSHMYSLLIDTYVKNTEEKNRLFNAIETIPAIKKKAEWTMKYINEECSLAKRLVIFSIVEGVMFQGSFCAIFWLKKQGKMPGLTHSNELISRDEGMHTEFGIELYRMIVNKLSKKEIYQIFEEAIEIETEFICKSIPCDLIGMNSKLMSQYIKFVADRLIMQLGYPKLYKAVNPFDFMELGSVRNKTNFFEKKVSEYNKAGSMMDASENSFALDANF
jgi:ribonucleoside-diphosphate reductase beta chain